LRDCCSSSFFLTVSSQILFDLFPCAIGNPYKFSTAAQSTLNSFHPYERYLLACQPDLLTMSLPLS
jgi:hypothetical protein